MQHEMEAGLTQDCGSRFLVELWSRDGIVLNIMKV